VTIRYTCGGLAGSQILERETAFDDPHAGSYTALSSWVYGRSIDEPLTMRRSVTPLAGGTTDLEYFYHSDDQHNVHVVTDENADVVEYYAYGVYGTPTIYSSAGAVRTASAIANPYMFTGREWDSESRLFWYRTRYYDPTMGRFTSRDTIGIWGDEANHGNGYSLG